MADGLIIQIMAVFGFLTNGILHRTALVATGLTQIMVGLGHRIMLGAGHRFTMADGLMTHFMDGLGCLATNGHQLG